MASSSLEDYRPRILPALEKIITEVPTWLERLKKLSKEND
jgi:hypothetical protein